MKLRPRPLGAWAPDQPATGGGKLTIARGVVPYKRHYAPLQQLVAGGDALDTRCLGAVALRDAAAAVHVHAGDAAKLYERNSDGTWTDRSRVGGYTATEATRWRFWAYGDRLLATNGQNEIQYRDMSGGGDFANLPGATALRAQFGCAFGQFVMLGNMADDAKKIVWSSIGDSEAYVGGVDQSGEEPFPDGGQITGFAVLDALYIFQESCIRRAVYVGPPAIFAFDIIEKERGCIAPGSLVQLGRLIGYRAEDGFYIFNGENSIPIGVDEENASLYDEWFIANAQRDYFYRMSAAVDPRSKTMRWLFASTTSATGQPDTMLIYNWSAGRASYAPVTAEVLAAMLTPSMSLEDLDALWGSLEDVPLSFDDPFFAGGVPQLGALDGDNKYASFSGENEEAVWVTDDFLESDGLGVIEAQAVQPLIDADDVRVSWGYRFKFKEAVTWSNESTLNAAGIAPCRSQGRFLRLKLRIPAGEEWTKAEGYAVHSVLRGQA